MMNVFDKLAITNIPGQKILAKKTVSSRQQQNASSKNNSGDWFISGPTYGRWWLKMLELPGRNNFRVALLLRHVYEFKKNPVIEVDRYLFDRLEIKKDSARRGLDLLQKKTDY